METVNQILSTIQTAKHPITTELQAAVVTEALKKKIQHRERCRANQARYRQRQDKIMNDIRDQIATLQAEVKELELRSHDYCRLPTMPSIWALAAEYVRHFRQFLSSPVALQAASASFLRGILAPDAVDASALAEQAQIESWKLFALNFDDTELELKEMNMPTPGTLVVGTSTTVTITNNTLRYAFPHLNSDGKGGCHGGIWSPLAARMLRQKLVMRGSVTFGLDNSSGKVMRIQTRADILSPMLKLLGNLEDVSCVFDKATVTPECQFVRKD